MSLTFKQYLEEKVVTPWRDDELSVENAIKLLNKHCKNGLKAVENGDILFRGFGGKRTTPFSVLDTTNSERTSRDFSGAYQIALENSEAYSHLPSRSRSLICSTSYASAKGYSGSSNPSIIIPFDGTDIASADVYDFISMPLKGTSLRVNNVDSQFKRFCRSIGAANVDDKFLQSSAEEIKKALKKHTPFYLAAMFLIAPGDAVLFRYLTAAGKKIVQSGDVNKLNEEHVKPEFYEFVRIFETPNRLKAVSSALFPKNSLNVKLIPFGEHLEPGECWFSGKCIVLSKEMYNAIVKQMKANGSSAKTV